MLMSKLTRGAVRARLLARSAPAACISATSAISAPAAALKNKEGNPMACFQCEQTATPSNGGPRGCTTVGVCGKTPQQSAAQDAITHALKGYAEVRGAAVAAGVAPSRADDREALRAVFATLTNVNFDASRCADYARHVLKARDALRSKLPKGTKLSPTASWEPASTDDAGIEAAGLSVGVAERRAAVGNEDVFALHELIMYGVRGTGAYAAHAMEAGGESDDIYNKLFGHLAVLARGEADVGKLTAEALAVGATNVTVLATLDGAHEAAFGAPVPTPVNHAPVAGKAILISGHDLVDLKDLLEQTAGTGINVFTHGEMLPAHGYPGLKKFPHLKGHYGSAWQMQKFEYGAFPGPIVQSTNCIMEPQARYKNRIFTTNSTGYEGVTHIPRDVSSGKIDFSPVIAAAQASEGFKATKPAKEHLTGFGHKAVLSVAPAVIDAVKAGKISRFVLIGGCDGTEPERAYYTRLATALPDSAVILTLGCAKFKLLGKNDYGVVPGTSIPRVLDMGQCNDSYSAVVVATELAKAFGCGVNDLPLSIVLSWLEQKAVAVLLSTLHLGLKGIRIGPSLPAFVTPNVLALLQREFDLKPVNNDAADGDVDAVMGKIKA